jgi:hypothetical protein
MTTVVHVIGQGEAMLIDFLSYMGILVIKAALCMVALLVPWMLLLCTVFVAWVRKNAWKAKVLVKMNFLLASLIGCAALVLQIDTLNTTAIVGYGLTVLFLVLFWLMRAIGIMLRKLFRKPRMQEATLRDA